MRGAAGFHRLLFMFVVDCVLVVVVLLINEYPTPPSWAVSASRPLVNRRIAYPVGETHLQPGPMRRLIYGAGGSGCLRDSRNAVRSANSCGFKDLPKAGMFTPPLTIRMMISPFVRRSPK